MGILTGDTNLEKDILGLSKPLAKLIQVVSDGIKGAAAPWQMKRIAKAELDIAKMKLLAEKDMATLIAQSEYKDDNLSNREIRQMRNVNNVVAIAGDYLLNENSENISEEEVNPDWSALYFDFVEKISDEDAQKIWGKILAGEIKSPGTFSLKALQTIFFFSKEDIESFISLTKFIFCGFHLIKDVRTFELNPPLELKDYGLAQSLGLLSVTPTLSGLVIDRDGHITFGNKIVSIRLKNRNDKINLNLPGFSLTPLGEELFKLAAISPTKEILEYYKKFIESRYPIEINY
ncbi:MAG: DUF2806 domain-containing protein [Bacteroides thetaiotaomicron]|uniref:DUF2806 domain-containing protein n=1 Tax=Bacteroides thetaiotaomicron TaxID=818 RepID=A0A943DXY9_BACT4|nr:DUF2806 domain-containing protein [Bacteroides thetaiotaomicron]